MHKTRWHQSNILHFVWSGQNTFSSCEMVVITSLCTRNRLNSEYIVPPWCIWYSRKNILLSRGLWTGLNIGRDFSSYKVARYYCNWHIVEWSHRGEHGFTPLPQLRFTCLWYTRLQVARYYCNWHIVEWSHRGEHGFTPLPQLRFTCLWYTRLQVARYYCNWHIVEWSHRGEHGFTPLTTFYQLVVHTFTNSISDFE